MQIYVIPEDQWGIDSIIPDRDGVRQYFASTSPGVESTHVAFGPLGYPAASGEDGAVED